MREIQHHLSNYTQDRVIMAENNADDSQVFNLAMGEMAEVAAELGKGNTEALASELADVIIFLSTIANNNNIDLTTAIMTKIARNHLKYPAHLFQGELSYEEAIKAGRQQWKDQGGDAEFYAE